MCFIFVGKLCDICLPCAGQWCDKMSLSMNPN